MGYEPKTVRPTPGDQPPIYFHAAWERAIHRFCRAYEESHGLERGETPLEAVQSFHDQWYQNREYRRRANELVECPVCKADFEEASTSGVAFPQPCPEALKRKSLSLGIRLGSGAKAYHSPSRV